MSIRDTKLNYIQSLNQLMTTSCILAGFAFSGLISLPGIEKGMYAKIVYYFDGDLELGFYTSFYTLFFSSICFLSTIMIILVYRGRNFVVPLAKLKFIHLVSNLTFSVAISSLMMSVIAFGIPNYLGICLSIFLGVVVGGSFIWENLLQQSQKRIAQLEKEEKEECSAENKEDQQEVKEKVEDEGKIDESPTVEE